MMVASHNYDIFYYSPQIIDEKFYRSVREKRVYKQEYAVPCYEVFFVVCIYDLFL